MITPWARSPAGGGPSGGVGVASALWLGVMAAGFGYLPGLALGYVFGADWLPVASAVAAGLLVFAAALIWEDPESMGL